MKDIFEKQHHGINLTPDQWETPVYRIFPWHRFIELMRKEQMVLVRPSIWEDPFENFLLKCKLKDGTSLEVLEKQWYGQCWTSNKDTDPMWRIYAPNKDGVQVSTTIEKLFRAIYNGADLSPRLNYFIGKISYIERKEIEDFLSKITLTGFILNAGGMTLPFAKLLCFKRTEFLHEQEIRILRRDDKCCTDILSIDIDPNKLFDNIVLDPRLDADTVAFQKRQLQEAGCTLPITQSEIYTVGPILEIEM